MWGLSRLVFRWSGPRRRPVNRWSGTVRTILQSQLTIHAAGRDFTMHNQFLNDSRGVRPSPASATALPGRIGHGQGRPPCSIHTHSWSACQPSHRSINMLFSMTATVSSNINTTFNLSARTSTALVTPLDASAQNLTAASVREGMGGVGVRRDSLKPRTGASPGVCERVCVK